MNLDMSLNITLLLFFIVAPVGGIDVLYFHIYKYRLASRKESRAETITHILRSLATGCVVLVLLNYSPQGCWFWVIGGLFVFDLFNNLVDAYLEKNSRKIDGGLESLEYMVHLFGATGMGAIVMSYFISGWQNQFLESKMVLIDRGFDFLFILHGWGIVIGSFILGLYESVTLIKNYRINTK